MESSDTGDYGINTPTYFCLDKLTVSTEPSSVEESVAAQMKVYYDRSNGAVRVESAQLVEAAVYNMSGTRPNNIPRFLSLCLAHRYREQLI